jgi:hypothetical protein
MMTGNLGCSRTTVATSGFEGSHASNELGPVCIDGVVDASLLLAHHLHHSLLIELNSATYALGFYKAHRLFHNEYETLHLH